MWYTFTFVFTPCYDMGKMYILTGAVKKNTVNSEIVANSVISHICDVKNLRLEHDLPISVNDRMISSFHEGYIFMKLKTSRKFPNLQ